MKLPSTSSGKELIDSVDRLILLASSSIYSGDGWSPVVILGHLSDVDEQVWSVRIELMLAAQRAKESRPTFSWWEPDPLATQLKYEQYSWEEAKARLHSTRNGIVSTLNVLDAEDWNASASHATFGILTLVGMVNQILIHDKEHLASLK